MICSAQNVEIFDLLALRAEEVGGTDGPTWPLVAQKLRQVLSQPNVLKIVPWDQSFKRNARVEGGGDYDHQHQPLELRISKLIIIGHCKIYLCF